MRLSKLFALVSLFLFSACEDPGPHIYRLTAAKQGLTRSGEVLPYAKAEGYFCVSPADMELMADLIKQIADPVQVKP